MPQKKFRVSLREPWRSSEAACQPARLFFCGALARVGALAILSIRRNGSLAIFSSLLAPVLGLDSASRVESFVEALLG
jgi:hypothetical protein